MTPAAIPPLSSDVNTIEAAPANGGVLDRPTMRARLDAVIGRVRKKLDTINGDTGKVAARLSPKATRMAQRAFSEADLEEDSDVDAA